MQGPLYWASYFICKGHELSYLLNLSEMEKMFFIESMNREREEFVEFEQQKIHAMLGK